MKTTRTITGLQRVSQKIMKGRSPQHAQRAGYPLAGVVEGATQAPVNEEVL